MSNNDFENNQEFQGTEDHEFKDTPGIVEAWNNSPVLKLMTLGAGVVVLLVAFLMFSGGEKEMPPSVVRQGSTVTETPGFDVDPSYEEALKQADQQRLEQALRQNESVFPTPRGSLRDRTGDLFQPDVQAQQQEDPLERWRRQAEERERQRLEARRQETVQTVTRQQQQQANVAGAQSQEQTSQLAQAMAAQMKTILDDRQPASSRILQVTNPEEFLKPDTTFEGGASAGGQDEESSETIIVPAGEMYYAQLLMEANSKISAPILAQIHSGPLRGSKLVGSFQKTQNDKLVIRFNRVVVDGVDYPIDTVAIDPSSRNPGLVTKVDYHLFNRVVLPAAVAFLEGISSAYAQRENNVVVSGDVVVRDTAPLNARGKIATGVEAAAGEVGTFLTDRANKDREPTVIVAAGTPVGILFLSPLVSR